MTVELREFIEARLADDEAMADSASGGPWRVYAERDAQHLEEDPVTGWRISTATGGNSESVIAELPMQAELDVSGGCVRIGALLWREAGPSPQERNATHIARHDPARVLRDVEARRRLLDQHQAVCDEVRSPKSAEHRMNARARQFALDEVLATLALPYADHPDFDPSWLREATT